MRVIIAGSRSLHSDKKMDLAVRESRFRITEVLSDMRCGVSTLGLRYASRLGIPVMHFPVQRSGLVASLARYDKMIKRTEAAIVIIDRETLETSYLIREMRRAKKPVHIKLVGIIEE